MRATIAIFVLGVTAAAAHAQSGAEAKAAADAAYEKGKALQDAGKCDEAIDHFAKSQELDPQLGTQYNLALCYEEVGRLASAWAEFNEVAAKDTKKKRKADAAKRAKAIEPKLTRMAITVAAPVDGLRITRDGVDVTVLVDVETPVDPAISDFEASAPGYGKWHEEVDLTAPGATVAVAVPALEKLTAPDLGDADPGDGVGPIDDGGTPVEPAPPRTETRDPGKLRRIGGLAMAGLGVVGVGVGLVFGFQAKGLVEDAETACSGELDPCFGDVPYAQGLIDDARDKATLSNLFVAGGAVLAAVGVVLWITAPGEETVERAAFVPVVSPDGLGLAYDGTW